jgi:hypothetical protein
MKKHLFMFNLLRFQTCSIFDLNLLWNYSVIELLWCGAKLRFDFHHSWRRIYLMGCLVIGCLKGYKRDLDFIKHRILLKRMQQEFRPETLLFQRNWRRLWWKPDDINKDGKVDDADKTALSPMNLIVEVHKIGFKCILILLGTKPSLAQWLQ